MHFEFFLLNWKLSRVTFLFILHNLYLGTNPTILYLTSLQIWGCEKSGLFHAFSKHILHRLNIPLHKRSDKKVHVTLLSRDTTYRRILNEKELIEGLQKNPDYSVKRVRMSLMNFLHKLVF
jgi:protein O-GlcNAc transferase